jgi:GTP-binding protein YchF
MKVAIAGSQGSGKTTLFSALTGIDAAPGKKENIGIIKVPDERIDNLSKIFEPKKTIYADVCLEDFGRLNSETLGKIRVCDEMLFVIDNYAKSDPLAELKDLELEFNMSDMDLVEKRLKKLTKEDPKSNEIAFLKRVNDVLEGEGCLRTETFSAEDQKLVEFYRFFSQKTCLVVINSSEERLGQEQASDFVDYCKKQGYEYVNLCATLEKEIAELPAEEQADFLSDYNLKESARAYVLHKSYELLGLISFFTVGKDEVRAWTITKDLVVKKAAGKIHSDLERGFIRAEVIAYDTFMEFKDLTKAKTAGKLRVEGKDYIVLDGDILNIRFNV